MSEFIWQQEHIILEVNPVMVSPDVEAVNKKMFQFSGRTLSGGGEKCQVVDFIADGISWDVKPSQWRPDETFIVFQFSKLQVLKLRPDAPAYPYDTIELSIKHSKAIRSGFGFVTQSISKALNMESTDSDLEDFIGKSWRVTMSMFNWGTINGVADQMGEIWNFSLASSAAGAMAVATTPPTSVPSNSPVATQPVEASVTVGSPSQTPEERALELLHGKTKDAFFPEVTTDKLVREDEPLFLGIIQETWLAGKIRDGKVTVADDGVHTVVGLS